MPNTSDAVTMVDSNVLAAVREEVEKAGHFMLQERAADTPSNVVTLSLYPSADGVGDVASARAAIRLRLVFQPQTVVMFAERSLNRRERAVPATVSKRTVDHIRDWTKATVGDRSRQRAEAA